MSRQSTTGNLHRISAITQERRNLHVGDLVYLNIGFNYMNNEFSHAVIIAISDEESEIGTGRSCLLDILIDGQMTTFWSLHCSLRPDICCPAAEPF